MSGINLGNLTDVAKKHDHVQRQKIRPTDQSQTEATNQIRAKMSILTASERALTALQGHKLFNDF